jgi:hypothetical protein
VAVLGVLGVSTLNRLGVGTQSDSTTAADRGGAAPGSAGALGATGPVTLPGNVQLLASGADYRPDTLPRAPMASIRADTPGTAETQGNEPERHFSTLVVPSELDRLTNPAALSACLSAVRQAYPGTAVLVDFARFNGAAAVVVVVAGVPEPRAGTWAVVVGAACGERGEADERSSARVG